MGVRTPEEYIESLRQQKRTYLMLTASEFAGWYHVMCISGGGASQTFKDLVVMECDFERCKGKARRAARIEDC